MRCNKARENLSLEIDGCLPPDSTVDLQKHLDGCADCRQYREDLLLGQRLLTATDPELSDNFEWRLQLKLNQTLQVAAGQVDSTWEEEPRNWWPWVRNFGAAASVGLAAVLTIAMLTGPGGSPTLPAGEPGLVAAGPTTSNTGGPTATPVALTPSRSTLQVDPNWRRTWQPNNNLRFVSGGGLPRTASQVNNAAGLRDGWSGSDVDDLMIISTLRKENRNLIRMLHITQQELQNLKAQLDTTKSDQLDLQMDQ